MDSSNQYLSNMNTSLITVVNLLQNEILTALQGVKTAIDEVKGEVQLLKESTKSSSVSSLFLFPHCLVFHTQLTYSMVNITGR